MYYLCDMWAGPEGDQETCVTSILSRHSLVQHQHEEDEDEHYQEQGHHTQTPPEHGEEEGLENVNLNLSNG